MFNKSSPVSTGNARETKKFQGFRETKPSDSPFGGNPEKVVIKLQSEVSHYDFIISCGQGWI